MNNLLKLKRKDGVMVDTQLIELKLSDINKIIKLHLFFSLLMKLKLLLLTHLLPQYRNLIPETYNSLNHIHRV